MTRPRFDAVVHGAVRDELAVSDTVLSKHVRVLEDAGYVQVRRRR